MKRASFGAPIAEERGFPVQPYASVYPRADANMDKENYHVQPPLPTKSTAPKKATLKRRLTDSAPFAPSNVNVPSKKQKTEQMPLPNPEDLPLVDDDGTKPPYSYAQLIGMAILRAPNRRLTLASIYSWISNSFSFYQAGDAGWQNSIRHNLSLNKAFHKQERPKDDPGKGNYWAIVSGMEGQFIKEKPRRNTLSSEGNSYPYLNANELPRPMTSSSNANFESSFPKKIDSSKFPEEAELSSDATIPASDPAIHEGIEPPAEALMPPPSRVIRSSPPPVDIRSSPPPVPEQEDTPPRHARQQPSSRPSGGRKRKFGGLGDSGYYSSIESSATRNVRFLTSEADRSHPAMKRGRAEEEIMRMRSSSIDISPSKIRSGLDIPISFQSSSPFKPLDLAGHGPLTPAVVFKKPARPPMSVSPGTNLRNHREQVAKQLLGSPDKKISVFEESPFKLTGVELPAPDFEIFAGTGGGEAFTGAFDVFVDEEFLASSPLKSTKRPRLERSATATDALHDVFGGRLGSPFGESSNSDFRTKLLGSPARLPSPIKRSQPTSNPAGLAGPSTIPHLSLPDIPEEDDFMFAVNIPSDDSDGVDISKGFHKIGTKPPPGTIDYSPSLFQMPSNTWMKTQGSPVKSTTNARPNGRPSLGRSTTTMF